MSERKKVTATAPKPSRKKSQASQAKLTPQFKMVKDLLGKSDLQPITSAHSSRRRRVVDAIEQRKLIENTALAQDVQLKKVTLFTLFCFLGVETATVFLFAFFQGVHPWGFLLEEWSFKLLIAATVTQITLMVQIAVKHLFPSSETTHSATSETAG